MTLCHDRLSGSPHVFRSMAGMTAADFDRLAAEVLPRLEEAERARRDREGRKRAPGGGHPFGLSPRDRILLTVLWLRHRPPHNLLGYLFGVSGTTAARVIARVLPLLEAVPVVPGSSLPSRDDALLRGGGAWLRGWR